MSYPPPPVNPGGMPQQPPGYPIQAPAPKKSKTKLIIGISAALVGLCCAGGAIAVVSGDSDSDTKKDANSIAAPKSTAEADATTADQPAEPVVEPQADEYTPKASDFKLKVKVLDKQCFGSAGCNVTYRVVPTYNGDAFDPAREAEVTYEVHGLEDTATSTFTMDGSGSANLDTEEMGSTSSSGKKLTAKVVEVETS